MTLPFQADGRHGRILVVDDQPVNIHALHQILAKEYEVLVATSGEQALELCRKAMPDLVLLDVMMPGMDGLEVCRQLKQHPDTNGISVIFVTAGSLPDEENACWIAGGNDFVNKPVNPLTLRNRVQAHLQFKFQVDALRAMAFADGLTGIANRRYLNEQLDIELRRCGRSRFPLGLLMIDVDFFKKYNDRYGHQAGDDCLKRVASAMAAEMNRPSDLAARYGGEEFVCLLPETDSEGALLIAKRIEAAVRALRIEHLDSAVDSVVTISVGVASIQPERDSSAEALIQRADTALYRAKQMGRGRACLAEEGV
ncbi:diguanylate cyclase [Oxalobacteraceae bacterium]|nr:diguanylate cyclase [Oxalobacteraceae bacterium]